MRRAAGRPSVGWPVGEAADGPSNGLWAGVGCPPEVALRRWLSTCIGALVLAGPARAQDPGIFRLDPVFVSVFRSGDPALTERARALEARLSQTLAERHLVLAVDQVPAFEDYSAEVYLLSCPLDQDPGCAYVIGDRGQADWAISGVVERGPDGVVVLRTTIVDVRGARAVVQFDSSADEAAGPAYAEAVADLIDRLAADGTDPVGASRRELEDGPSAAERAAIAASLGQLESELGSLDIRERDRAMQAPKLTAADIARYREREGAKPWERMRLTASQYQRMRNRGFTLEQWRERLAGREGRLLLRGHLAGGARRSTVVVDARWVVDPSVGDVVRREVFQELVPGSAFGAGLEVAVGLTPWLDVGAVFETGFGRVNYLLHPEELGDAREPDPARSSPEADTFLGGRLTVAPLPAATVRPTGQLAVGRWYGPGLGRAISLASVPTITAPAPPRVTQVRLGPGFEVQASPQVALYGRFEVGIPLAGDGVVRYQEGPEELIFRGVPQNEGGVDLVGQIGLQVGLGPLWTRRRAARPGLTSDDEPAPAGPPGYSAPR